MNLLAIVGSPRKDKATDTLVDKALYQIEDIFDEIEWELDKV